MHHHLSEGIIVERVTKSTIRVDFGNSTGDFDIYHCDLILRSDEYEVGDVVKMSPSGGGLYFSGRVVNVNEDGTLDIHMDGDDPDDIEHSVDLKNVIKVMTRRAMVISRWRAAAAAVIAANAMAKASHRTHDLEAKVLD